MKNKEVDDKLWGLGSYAAWYVQNIKHHGSCANNFYRPIAKYIEELEDENDRLKAQSTKTTNAEKYAEQIAHLIAEDHGGDTCTKFGATFYEYSGGLNCSTCPLHGICNDEQALVEWLRKGNEK